MNAPTSSIFESFNARALKPWQVAETFVPSDHFRTLVKRQHSLIVGPRGSGKTTLLKMLQQRALQQWAHPDADDVRNKIDFTGIFVFTDISWREQLAALEGSFGDTGVGEAVVRAAITSHVLRAVIVALIQRIADVPNAPSADYRRANLNAAQESELSAQIAEAWHLKPRIFSLLAIKQALTARLSSLGALSEQARLSPSAVRTEVEKASFYHLPFLAAAAVAVEAFDDAIGEQGTWAFLFDELELAPEWLRDELVRGLRSRDDRFLFKLALSPYWSGESVFNGPTAPAAGADFDLIELWYAERVTGLRFCEELWAGIARARGLGELSPRSVLGSSYFETLPEEWAAAKTAYTRGSRLAIRFRDLAEKDASFRHYLSERGIDVDGIDTLSANERAADIRKISPLIPVREFYRGVDLPDGVGRFRSRKSPTLYAGAESVFAITEGNPRWFIGLMDRLLDRRSPDGTVSEAVQAEELHRASARFAAMLRTIPVDTLADLGSRKRGVLSLLSAAGDWFHTQVAGGEFQAEPAGTFTVDSNLPKSLYVVLGKALNAGAIIYVPSDDPLKLLTTLRGKRFRISYLLAPKYGLPLRLGRERALSHILRERQYIAPVEQLSLTSSD